MSRPDPEITDLLLAWSGGDEKALTALMPRVYKRLQQMAAGYLSRERQGHTLQTEALVNEAYLRLVDVERVSWSDRAHFFAVAARMMRRVLVDHARRRAYAKRGAGARHLPEEILERIPAIAPDPDLLAVDEALSALAEKDPQLVQIVELKYFGGMTKDEIAEAMGIASATVTRRWRTARAWLYGFLASDELPS